ncbi:hypothetical protein D7294_09225 [Streptomyces hoynatensis]|uniref:Uncharacterized protein n=2 Tax=Streptomyces hoynatensis TaxID=1141874 RepID=A0A3A9Z6D9_9ACTN|nr:hypothetical protein D7294_09225 [Streptomyces hoynatensis]
MVAGCASAEEHEPEGGDARPVSDTRSPEPPRAPAPEAALTEPSPRSGLTDPLGEPTEEETEQAESAPPTGEATEPASPPAETAGTPSGEGMAAFCDFARTYEEYWSQDLEELCG